MARSDGYNTKTRQLILDYLIRNRQHAVSASNILEHLEAEGASPNPTTVYRIRAYNTKTQKLINRTQYACCR